MAIRALGDFTSTVSALEPGTKVYVDGPHGAFSIDQDEGPGFGLIAGGVGIAGLISMLRTMADRNDVRPVLLFYGNREWDDVAFRDELEQLKERLDLTLVHVLERPPAGLAGGGGLRHGRGPRAASAGRLPALSVLHLRAGSDDGRGGDRPRPSSTSRPSAYIPSGSTWRERSHRCATFS